MEALGKLCNPHAAPGRGRGVSGGEWLPAHKKNNKSFPPPKSAATRYFFFLIFKFFFSYLLLSVGYFHNFKHIKGAEIAAFFSSKIHWNKLLPITTPMCLQHKPSRRSSSSSPRTVPRLVRQTGLWSCLTWVMPREETFCFYDWYSQIPALEI